MQPGDYLLHDLARYTKSSSSSSSSPSKTSKKGGKGNEDGATVVVDPDICILFGRYANAGRTINVYDWFESFMQGVEAARLRARKVDKPSAKSTGKGKGKARKSAVVVEEEGEGRGDGDGEEEGWRREVYGRFMWAVHEMDMLGLLRWTGRGTGKKGAECAGKVVWVVPE
jgi:origin recognition complex subunit 3